MPMLLGAKGKDILQWRASSELVSSLTVSFARKWGSSSAGEAESLLRQFISALGEELEYESQLLRETTALDEAIAEAATPTALQPLLARYREVVSAHFSRRRSVLSLCSICNRLHDLTVSKVVDLARARMNQLGQGTAPPHALMVCGDRGRGEQTLCSENRYLLFHGEDDPRAFLFSRQLSIALREAGVIPGEERFRHGPLSGWGALLAGSLRHERSDGSSFVEPPRELAEWEWRLEAMTDLAFSEGEDALASESLDATALAVLEERNRGSFIQLARKVITLPLALGRFGRWRVERDGEHRGEVNVEEYALRPLVAAVRVLAVHVGVSSGGTVQRIQALLERGALPVELSERLLKAYQFLMQLRILSEIRSEQSGAFCNIDELAPDEEQRLRESLDTVLSLQKIAYQRMVGLG